jgi:hypothetical protein
VHPNYLIPAAVLLPVGVLARRLRADLALVPLLLFALAVEIAERQVFKTVWDQAVAADLPTRLGGLVAVLAPLAGPHLTRDALGLLFSATAAGLAVAYLTVGLAGAGRRIRTAAVALAGILVVAVPLLVMVGVGDRTGLLRAQDPAVVQSAGDAGRLAAGRSPYTPPPEDTPRGREVYATSFRLDPPVEIRPDQPNMPPGLSVLATLGRLVDRRDIRLWTLFALAVLAALVVRRTAGEGKASALGLALLLAPLALGTVVGAPTALALCALLGAWLLARTGPPWVAGVLAGLAFVLDHRAVLLAPLLLLPLADRRAWRPAAVAGALAYGLVVVPVALLDLPAFIGRLVTLPSPGAGMGVFNVFAFKGVEAATGVRVLAALAPVAAVVVPVALVRRKEVSPLALAGLAGLGWIAVAPSVSPDAVGVPVVLLGLAGLWGGAEDEG